MDVRKQFSPFKDEKEWKPDKEEVEEKLPEETENAEKISQMISNWLISAYFAGERAAHEDTEIDKTKLFAMGAIGFMGGFLLAQFLIKNTGWI